VEMDLDHLPLAILIVLIGIVVGLGVWYLAIRLNQPRLRMIAVVIGVFPMLGFGMQVASYFFDWGGPPDTYTTVTPGLPVSRNRPHTNGRNRTHAASRCWQNTSRHDPATGGRAIPKRRKARG
jgi:hypothetical protein